MTTGSIALMLRRDLPVAPTHDDPYYSVRFLGQGGFGCVDAVVKRSDTVKTSLFNNSLPSPSPGTQLYARKRFKRPVVPPAQRKKVMQELAREADILRSMCFRHIVELVEHYHYDGHFCLVLSPVADGTLTDVLALIDCEELGRARDEHTQVVKRWPYCLLQAVAYLHAMRIKHRDIKPSNVLVYNETILLADFGIAKMIEEGEETGSEGTVGCHTYSYSAPEVVGDVDVTALRGRAMDIFSLGCVFLELSTALVGPPGARQAFSDMRRESSGTLAYSENQLLTLQWIWYLWTYDYHAPYSKTPRHRQTSAQGSAATAGFYLSELAFLMLDPNPIHRITARQLLEMTDDPVLSYFYLKTMSCAECQASGSHDRRGIIPHSVFKPDGGRFAKDAERALDVLPAEHWGAAKEKWLASHVHWRGAEDMEIELMDLVGDAGKT